MKKKILFNKTNREELKQELAAEPFNRNTASFYRYVPIADPQVFRDELYLKWDELKVFGRVYVATEGINAQISVPEQNWDEFPSQMNGIKELKGIPIKRALQDGHSFYKLSIKVRDELVSYGIPETSYDMNRVGNHLAAKEYNAALEDPNTTIVDMRNYYESEIGCFDHAIIPDVETSRDLLPEVQRILKGKEAEPVLLYCTGGIRCEKASAYLIHHGFQNVHQLQGGIIQYVHDVREQGLESKFKGKNFVFDERLGERVTDDVLAACHICGNPCDDHTDCKNDACHILFIQCSSCSEKLNGCCSEECRDFAALPLDEQKRLRKDPERVVSKTFFDSRVKPKLNSNP